MSVNIELLKTKINQITDPDLGYSFEKLNYLKDIIIENQEVLIKLELIPPIEWLKDSIIEQIKTITNEVAPEFEPKIEISERQIPKTPRKFLKGVKHIIAVASGKGGVGKSAVASNIAATLSLKGVKVGLIDGDIYGPSQPTIWGMKNESLPAEPAPDGGTIVYPAEKHNIKIASMGFLMKESDAAIVRGPILASYLQMLIEQIEWGELDFLVFDLPPGTGDIQLTLTQQTPLTGAIVITTPQEISVVDVRRSVKMFEKVKVPVLGIIENMSYFIPEDAPDKKYYIFGKGGGKRIADESKVRFLGEIPLVERFRESNDNGLPFVLNSAAGEFSDIFNSIISNSIQEIRRINYDKTKSTELEISI
ncbi:MAG: Mrp/NBP35 family ATP-binding protein [Candidatus Kapaibacteriota bacterium]